MSPFDLGRFATPLGPQALAVRFAPRAGGLPIENDYPLVEGIARTEVDCASITILLSGGSWQDP